MRLRSDLGELLLAAQEGKLASADVHWSPNPSICVVLTSKGYPAKPETGKVITGYEAVEALGGVKIFHAATKVEEHQLRTTGGRVMGVTAIAEDLPSAIQRAYAGVNKLQFEGMHYRTDIGGKALNRISSAPAPKRSRAPKGERQASRK
jgi:phosphoribosylamine--glycine ligase